jgi:formylglycine-generating enzyme required for sulfatase activity
MQRHTPIPLWLMAVALVTVSCRDPEPAAPAAPVRTPPAPEQAPPAVDEPAPETEQEPEPPAASTFPPAATAAQAAIFTGSPEEPPPEERTDDQHYVHSNEQHHELFFPFIRGIGGGYVGVGSDQNYTLAAHARSEWVWLMDYDTVVNQMHRVVMALVAEAGDAPAYMHLWQKEAEPEALAIIGKAYAGRPDLGELEKVYRRYRSMTAGYNERVTTRARAGKCAFWLQDEGSYEYIRALVLAGRVRALRGDLREQIALKGIGEAAGKLGTTIRTVYMSDAESFFHYTEGFRTSLASLPLDEKSVVLRTASGKFFDIPKADYQWHYNVHHGLHFQGMMDQPGFTKVFSALKKSRPTGIEGVSATGWEDAALAFVKDAAPVPSTVTDSPPPECGKVPEGMACVPGGLFWRGADDAGDDRKPRTQIWVSTFWIDTHEVTNEEFNACIKAGACKKHERYKGFMGARQPAVGITWYNAHAYCAWAGKRLPTEAEWEKAARGPGGDLYPWGNDAPTCGLAQFRGCSPPTTLDVGSFSPGHYGLFDMAGNGYEWVQDWYSPCYDGCEGGCGEACSGKDPKGPCDGMGEKCSGFLKLKVLRGGSWFWPSSQIPASWRRPYKPDSGEHRLSVRCAMTPPGAGG